MDGATFGGGVYGIRGLQIDDSTIRDNHGWGVNAYRALKIRNTTISGNDRTGIVAAQSLGSLRVSNSTISGNGDAGLFTNHNTVLDHVTITDNASSTSGGGLDVGEKGRVSSQASIVAGNTAPSAPDCASTGRLRAVGANLIGDPTGCTLAPGSTAPLVGDPLLGPLAGNGGPTETHALLPGSPAIAVLTKRALCRNPDQRGVARSVPCDLGAYEAP